MDDLVRASRRERYRLRRELRDFTSKTMQRRCGMVFNPTRVANFFLPDEEMVRQYRRAGGYDPSRIQLLDHSPSLIVEHGDDGPLVRVSPLVWCERFTCPVCGPLMWVDDAVRLQRGAIFWQQSGGEVLDVVLRLQPLKRRNLDRTLSALMDGWDATIGRRQEHHMRRTRFLGIAGYHQQLVIGIDAHGRWDPCLRALLFIRGGDVADPAVLRRVSNALWQGWVTGNRDVDLRPPTRKRGLAVSHVGSGEHAAAEAVGRYVAGIGCLPVGTSSMIDILTAACAGDVTAKDRWDEIELTLTRRHNRGWARGTKALLGVRSGTRLWPVTLERDTIGVFDANRWADIEPFMLGLIEEVEDAVDRRGDPYQALAVWTRTFGIADGVTLRKPKHPQRPRKRNQRRRR